MVIQNISLFSAIFLFWFISIVSLVGYVDDSLLITCFFYLFLVAVSFLWFNKKISLLLFLILVSIIPIFLIYYPSLLKPYSILITTVHLLSLVKKKYPIQYLFPLCLVVFGMLQTLLNDLIPRYGLYFLEGLHSTLIYIQMSIVAGLFIYCLFLMKQHILPYRYLLTPIFSSLITMLFFLCLFLLAPTAYSQKPIHLVLMSINSFFILLFLHTKKEMSLFISLTSSLFFLKDETFFTLLPLTTLLYHLYFNISEDLHTSHATDKNHQN